MLILYLCVYVSVWDNLKASDWSKLGIRNGIHGDQEWYTRSSLIGRKSPTSKFRSSQFVWWRHQASHNIARLYTHHTAVLYAWDIARRRQTSYDVARLLLMVPLEPWRNSTPFFGAAAICTTKIDDFRASMKLTSCTGAVQPFWILLLLLEPRRTPLYQRCTTYPDYFWWSH